MRYLLAATAALCLASSASAATKVVTLHGSGVAKGVEHATSPDWFVGVNGQTIDIKVELFYVHFEETWAQEGGSVSFTRRDTGEVWLPWWGTEVYESAGSIYAISWYSWWGAARQLTYDFATGTGTFHASWWEEGTIEPGPYDLWSEASGVWHTSRIEGVPEPASWAMLIAGFGLVGAALRRPSLRPDT